MESKATNYVVVDRNVLAGVIESMKKIDVRGFESMDRLVGCVCYLQSIMNQAPLVPNEPNEKDGGCFRNTVDEEEKNG